MMEMTKIAKMRSLDLETAFSALSPPKSLATLSMNVFMNLSQYSGYLIFDAFFLKV